MLNLLPSVVLEGILLLLFSLNTILWCSILFPFVLIKLIIPHKGIRYQFSKLLILFAIVWLEDNDFIFRITQKIKRDVQGLENLSLKKSNFVVSNHLSCTIIFVLQHIFKHRIPFLKSFLIKVMICVPSLGMAWWTLDFPFLKNYSQQFQEKHPELHVKDMEVIRKSCEMFKSLPVFVMNFLKGTLFNYQKHKGQNIDFF